MANWALVILTLGLVIVTFWYMRHTKRMADIMAREFELRIAPFLVLETIPTFGGGESRQYRPVICNKGSLPVRIRRIVLEWWYTESPDKTYRKETPLDRALGRDERTDPGEYVITLRHGDMVKQDFEPSQTLDADQLRASAQGKIYCVYTDTDGIERETAVLRSLETL